MKNGFRVLFGGIVAVCAVTLAVVGYWREALPDSYSVGQGETLTVNQWIGEVSPGEVSPWEESRPAVAKAAAATRQTCLRLWGAVAVKTVAVTEVEKPTVTVCGSPFGVKLYTDGVLVVGLGPVSTPAGTVSPGEEAGLRVGDTILTVDGTAVSTNRRLGELVSSSGGKPLSLRVGRDGVAFNATLTPVAGTGEGRSGYFAGLWVRDSSAGVGILTFYDRATGMAAGLGHSITDADTRQKMSVSGGEIVPAGIFSVTKSTVGTPGELCGTFLPGSVATLDANLDSGLYGHLKQMPTGETMPLALSQEVHTGKAEILTTLSGVTPKRYSVTVERVRGGGTRNMVIRVTDAELLRSAGGIVQGMSGSPIIQDGKLIGAVTHVLVNDPTRGYAIFAETMLEAAQSVAGENKLKDAS